MAFDGFPPAGTKLVKWSEMSELEQGVLEYNGNEYARLKETIRFGPGESRNPVIQIVSRVIKDQEFLAIADPPATAEPMTIEDVKAVLDESRAKRGLEPLEIRELPLEPQPVTYRTIKTVPVKRRIDWTGLWFLALLAAIGGTVFFAAVRDIWKP
jgi:hypothetical protein